MNGCSSLILRDSKSGIFRKERMEMVWKLCNEVKVLRDRKQSLPKKLQRSNVTVPVGTRKKSEDVEEIGNLVDN